MTTPSLIWGSPDWITRALVLAGVAALVVLWSYARARTGAPVRVWCALLKAVGLAALILSLIDPLLTGSRPRRGANVFVIAADNSQSLLIRDDGASGTRGDWLHTVVQKDSSWQTRLGQDFDVRRYLFDSHLRAVEQFDTLSFDGGGTALTGSLSALARRFRGLPIAGVLLLTDGNRTDLGDVDWSQLPPVYPVAPPARGRVKDIGVSQVSISQTNFESAPVVLRADVSAPGFEGAGIVVIVTDENDKTIERQEAKATADGKPLSFRFQFRPERKGVSIYSVKAFAASEEPKSKDGSEPVVSTEQTLANNSRLVVVDQGSGPYRVLYVSGRPNWEFKFLRRAEAEDEQVQLVGLVRIAKRQPKFDFRSARTQSTSPLFDGFDHPDAETAERQDQPVLVRLGTVDEVELRDGFPKKADELYRYHAIIIDDIEAAFFSPDQRSLLRNFVSQRGGGLLMLGGLDSFVDGKYDRTQIGELLPVYLNQQAVAPGEQEYRLVLTREGWLQPWVRTRKTEDDERQRLGAMSTFRTLNRVGNIKPGAAVLAEVRDSSGQTLPALVTQAFGKGHVAALLIGDLWRWSLQRQTAAEDDFDRAWRQTVRWLVGDVPARVEITVRPKAEAASSALSLSTRVRDAEFRPLDNAKVVFRVALPGGDTIALDAEPDNREPGAYSATYVPKQPGAYRIVAAATAPDGSAIGEREGGWASQPAADEFARLTPDHDFLKTIAAKTGGEVVDANRLDSFVASLSSRHAPITEPWTSPLWHNPVYFLIALVCLAAEWGLRRVNGLA